MIDLNPPPPVKCKHCKKPKGEHRAKTFECPFGLKTSIGYTNFGKTVFEPSRARKDKESPCPPPAP